jgi:hypothetical protein
MGRIEESVQEEGEGVGVCRRRDVAGKRVSNKVGNRQCSLLTP